MPSRSTVVAAAALFVASALAASAPASASAALPADGYVEVIGKGFGHGRGLAQWGAKGLADQGSAWTQILSHYYRNTTMATRAAETIRVLVEDSADVVVTSQAHPFSVHWKGAAKIADSSAANPFLRAVVTGSGSSIAVQRAAAAGGPWTTIATGGGIAEFRAGSQPLGLVLGNGSVKYYRGVIDGRRPSGSSSMLAINDLTMEAYLYGVVPREVPAGWDGDALRAQAVSARSYAANKKDAARAAGKLYDICATTACQVYGGYASGASPSDTPRVLESQSTTDAVNDTAGKVLTYNGKPILAEYSSSSGGHTTNGSVPYMVAVPDPTDSVSPYHNWTTRASVATINRTWPAIGSLVGVRVTKRNGYGEMGGRVTEMMLDGTSGTVTISGNTFRSKLRLRSDWFRVNTFRAETQSPALQVSAPVDATIPVTFALKNVGTAEWRLRSRETIATTPSGRTSPFAGSEWLAASKPTAITKNLARPSATTVGPGETAEFRFLLHTTGVRPGVYQETFRPLVEGLTWMNDVGLRITVTVLSSWIEEAGNVVTNGSFEHGWSAWSGSRVTRADGPASGSVRDGSRSMHLAGGGKKNVSQTLSVVGSAGRRLVLGGWAKTTGTSTRGGPILVTLALRHTDGSSSWHPVEFSRGAHDWQYVERLVVAPRSFSSAAIYAVFYDQPGHVYFDALRVTDNWVANPSFDLGSSGWSASGFGSGDGPTPNVFRDGHRAMHLAGGTKSLTQRLPVRGSAGRFYAAGLWTKADRANAAGTTSLVVTFRNVDGSTSRVTVAAPAGDHGWTFTEQHLSAPKSFTAIDLSVAVSGQSGSIFVDGVRFRENRIPNGSFEQGMDPWQPAGPLASGDGVVTTLARDATKSLSVAGGGRTGATMRLASGGSAGTTIFAGAWNKATAATPSSGQVWLGLGFVNRDGTKSFVNLQFPKPAHDWVHHEMAVRAPKAYSAIDVYLLQQSGGGEIAFDGVTLWAP